MLTLSRDSGPVAATLLLLVAVGLLGCGQPGEQLPPDVRVADLDSLFPLLRRANLAGTGDHPVGLISDADVAPDGTIFLADVSMREVKAVSSEGNLIEVIGSVGEGPGQYMQPVSLTLSPTGRTLLVGDPTLGRAVRFDAATGEYDEYMINLDPPVSLHSLRHLTGDTLIVAGIPRDYPYAEDPEVLALFSTIDSTWTSRLPIPQRLQKKAVGQSTVSGLVAVEDTVIFAAVDGHPVIYRLSTSGDVRDSLRLPTSVYPEVDLPARSEWKGGVAALRDFTQSKHWIRTLVSLSDGERVAFAIDQYDERASEWVQRVGVADFGRHSVRTAREPCDCLLLGSRADTAVLMRGTAGTGFTFEWRATKTDGSSD